MIIQFNTDHNITAGEKFIAPLTTMIESELERYAGQLTRIEVHLGDENSHKSGENDKRCMMEARPQGMAPIAVTAHEGDYDKAVASALDKLRSALDTKIGKLRNH